MVEVLMKGGADRYGVVALLVIEQAVPDQRIDFAIADFDRQTAQAASSRSRCRRTRLVVASLMASISVTGAPATIVT
jgi:hypothetical protein